MRERRIAFAPTICVLLVVICVSLASAEHKKQLPAAPIDLNAATATQLQQLPGVGPGMAKAIVAFRQKSGPFRRVEDLLAIRGITKERLEKMRPYVNISPPGAKKQSSNP
jgi:competence protein ComEA